MAKRSLVGIAALACAIIAAAVVGLAMPRTLAGAGTWSLVVLAVLYGYGSLARRAFAIDLMIGEQLALGAIGWIAITGVLLAIGVASRVPLLVLAAVGVLLAFYDLVSRARTPRDTPSPKPSVAAIVLGSLLGLYLVASVLGTVASRGNPYDDQTAYMQFVTRVLDCGDLIEPFSFRRLSAYGGQTLLLALAAARGDVESIDLLDRGIFQVVAVLLVISVMRRRKVNLGVAAIVIFFLLTMWDLSINCASVWTGFTLFGTAYAFASREELAPRARLLIVLAACGAACTLRQNYLAPAGLFGFLVVASHLRAAGAKWRDERKLALLAVGVAAIIVLPYMVAAFRSNHTALYPIFLGDGNPAAPLQPAAHTWIGELAFMVDVMLSPEPIRVWWLLVPAMLLARDERLGKPFTLYAISSAFGFFFLIHSFQLSESSQLWRYSYGYLSPLAIMFLVEVVAQLPFLTGTPTTLKLPSLAALVVWLAVLAQIVESRNIPGRKFVVLADNIAAAESIASKKEFAVGRAAYRDLQAAIPEDESLAVLVDNPYLLDHARNRIFNLDIPGFAAPALGLPSFKGPAALRAYFLGLGIRYLAFVDHEHASYLYRRAGWFLRMLQNGEIWNYIAAHMIDAEDNLTSLSKTSRIVFHRDGLYAIDLGTEPAVAIAPWTKPDEIAAMYSFIKTTSEAELGSNAWELASRGDVVFVPDGGGPSDLYVDQRPRPRASENPLVDAFAGFARPIAPHRWLMDRTHIRVKGTATHQHLSVELHLDLDKLLTQPSITFSLDEHELGTIVSPADGHVVFEADAACEGWCDLYISVSTMSEWWNTADYVRSIKLRGLRWDQR